MDWLSIAIKAVKVAVSLRAQRDALLDALTAEREAIAVAIEALNNTGSEQLEVVMARRRISQLLNKSLEAMTRCAELTQPAGKEAL